MPPDDAVPTLIAELDRATRAYPHDRKLLVGVRPAEGRELLRTLSLSGRSWIGWEPWSLRLLAHAVVALDVAREGLRTADSFDVMALVDVAIDAVEAAGDAGPFGDAVPGAYRDPIRRTVETLRLAGIDGRSMASVAASVPKLRTLAAVLAAYEAALSRHRSLDGPALLARAADVLTADRGDIHPLADARLFLLPGLGLRGEEGRLVRALLERGATVLATDPVAGLADPPGTLWAARSDAPSPLSRLHAPGAPGGATASPARPTIDLFAAATPADELREVIRRVLAAGVAWDEVEIVATDTTTYGVALDGLARRLEIPVTHSAGLPLSRTRVGRAADAYFRWIADGFPADTIRHLLESGDLDPAAAGPGGDANPASAAAPTPTVSPAALARRLRRLRVGWGHDRYLPAVDRALAAVDRAGPLHGEDVDPDTARHALERERAELTSLRALLKPILDATPRPARSRAAWADRTSPARLADGLRALLARVPEGDQVENTARTVLVQRLERARATLTRDTGWLAATAMLRSRLETRVAATSDGGRLQPWTSTGGHLHLSDIAMGGLTGRPYTFVVGLAAGAVVPGGTDPLLNDVDRARLNRSAAGSAAAPPPSPPSPPATAAAPAPLPSQAEGVEESRHALASMLARLRGRVTLSYAAWDMSEGRTIGPAPELLQALRLRDGDASLSYRDLRERLGRLACPVPAAAGPADGADVWLAALATPDGPLRDGRAAVRALHPGLDRGLAALEAHEGDRLTPYHGLLAPDPALDPLAGDAVLSASRLETLGKCPLQYFYRYVLAVRPVRDPEYDPERWLDALERGELLHAVYERALGELPSDAPAGAQDAPAGPADAPAGPRYAPGGPDPVDYDDPAFLAHALAVLDDEVRRTLHRLPAPNRSVLASERESLEADVRSFVAMVREQRPRVVRTELAFGPDPDADGEVQLDVAGGRGRLRLRGRVDRLDALDGGGLRVVDYKTGRARGFHPAVPFDGGRRLQHLLYALAVERLRPGERVERAEYHFPTTRGENHVAAYTRADLDAGHDVLGALLDLARDGRFLATTDDRDCAYCDFRDVCRVRTDEWGGVESPRADWAKASAPGIAGYASLVQLRTRHGGDG